MPFLTAHRVLSRIVPQLYASRFTGARQRPECVVLEPRAGTTPSPKAPVRIYLGTEAGQYRAERVFIWSIEQVRDPSRRYEIYLMKDMADFDRRSWLTGFTNFRFAIPHFAGCSGRAIYNDVDQIYLADPAELFDTDLDGHGFLAISDRDTSVMLIDCERMAEIWTIDTARVKRRKQMEAAARAVGAWGPLDRGWNSRDGEYVEGCSKLLHYTTIHTQPWRPFPEQYVYQHNPVGFVWHDLERSADAAGFQPFTFRHPTSTYVTSLSEIREARARASATRATASTAVVAAAADDLRTLLARTQARSILDYDADDGICRAAIDGLPDADRQALAVTSTDGIGARTEPPAGGFDVVACTSLLERLSDEDIPWVLDELFRCARRAVYVRVNVRLRASRAGSVPRLDRPRHGADWWLARIEATAARHPSVYWRLRVDDARSGGRAGSRAYDGGCRFDRDRLPTTWVLADHKAGHMTQSVGLAQALGWPYEVKTLEWSPVNVIADRAAGPLAYDPSGRRAATLRAPWPDLVISTGWRTAPIVRWIAEQSGGRTRTIQMGRKGGGVASGFDLVVSCSHFRLPPHPHRIEITAPLTQVTAERLAGATARWPKLFGDAPRPRIVLLVGGTSRDHRFDSAVARELGQAVGAFARKAGGFVFAVTSPRTGEAASAALEAGLGGAGRIHRWRHADKDNPYLAYVAGADAIVVTGDSESMLSEATTTAKPVYIYPIPTRARGPVHWLAERITRRAYSRPKKKKGTVRPQQGLEYLCSRLIERGLVVPPRDLSVLHRELEERGVARPFGAPLDLGATQPLDELAVVVARVRAMMGWSDAPPARAAAAGREQASSAAWKESVAASR
jgi:uncharacterized protein